LFHQIDRGDDVNSQSTELFIATLAFGVLALAGTALVQGRKGQALTANFVKLFGLLFIGTLATAITFAGVGSETRTGAYTILGTIAGYLAGSRVQTKTDPVVNLKGEESL
jgi:hypothetical protein